MKYFALLLTSLFISGCDQKDLSVAQKEKVIETVKEYFEENPEELEAVLERGFEKKRAQKRKDILDTVKNETQEIFFNSNSPVLGNKDADVNLVVFIDHYCKHCHTLEKTIEGVLKKRKDVRVVYKTLPIISQESLNAAKESIAAHLQGRFEHYIKTVMKTNAKTQSQRLSKLNKKKVNLEKLKADASSQKVHDIVMANVKLADRLGYQGTPSFIFYNTKGNHDPVIGSGVPNAQGINKIIDRMK